MKKTRLDFEKDALRKMVLMYCRGQKHGAPPCPDCRNLLDYSLKRLDACVFGEAKTFCSKCPIRCYKPEMRENIRKVMRYSGPRMLFRDPVMALRHIFKK